VNAIVVKGCFRPKAAFLLFIYLRRLENVRTIEARIGCMSAAEDTKWSVLLLNDDMTPMDFVVDVIEQVFDIDLERARRLMLRVHNEGAVACGAYSQEIARAKAAQVMDLAREHRHPLQCVVERKP
jgi:ATP-dependent Clp protease adaptor protein ClpS